MDCVLDIYREFIVGYLNILRQKNNKPADWVPETISIDTELTTQMGHFFSDYQHVTAEFNDLNLEMKRLLAMDGENHQKIYQHTIAAIVARFAPQVRQRAKDEE